MNRPSPSTGLNIGPPLAPADLEVLGAERRRHVHDRRCRRRARRSRPRRRGGRPRRSGTAARSGARRASRRERSGSRRRASRSTALARGRSARISRSPSRSTIDVGRVGVDRDARVRDQRPRRRRPPEQRGADERRVGGLDDREPDEDARVLDRPRTPARPRRPTARSRTAGSRSVTLSASNEQAPLVQPLERPPHALDVLGVHRPVGVVGVDPEAEALGQALELVDVALHRLAASAG